MLKESRQTRAANHLLRKAFYEMNVLPPLLRRPFYRRFKKIIITRATKNM